MKEDITIKYENIAVIPEVKEQFNKQFEKAKKGKRHFYRSDYLKTLLDLEVQK